MVFVFSGLAERFCVKGRETVSFVPENNTTTGLHVRLLLKPNWTVYVSSHQRVISFVGIYQ